MRRRLSHVEGPTYEVSKPDRGRPCYKRTMSDRKYGHRGYQDDDRDDRPRGPRRPAGERRPGPRGRGFGAPTATVFRCAVCGQKQREGTSIGVDSTCWKCAADLHTCTHCRHFDPSAPGQCRARAPEVVAAKAKSNACELFAAKETQEIAEDLGGDSPSGAKAAFDALFKL